MLQYAYKFINIRVLGDYIHIKEIFRHDKFDNFSKDKSENSLNQQKNIINDNNIMIKGLLIILLFVGIIFIVIAVTNTQQQCPQQKIIYRYVPRTFDEEQDEPVYVSDIFKVMFTQPSVWNQAMSDADRVKYDTLNKYFLSQT
jgi:hypothetical protein